MTSRSVLLRAVVAVGCVATVAAQDPAARTAAARMQQKLVAIVAEGERATSPRGQPAQKRTPITEQEANAFFTLHGATFMPEGVGNPQVAIEQGGRLRAKAMVDLDVALKPKERSWLDPLAWLGGKVEVTAVGVLRADKGTGLFALEQATLGGVTVPKSLLQELVSHYSRTPDTPKGFSLDQPFELPAKIRSVETAAGLAIVTQ